MFSILSRSYAHTAYLIVNSKKDTVESKKDNSKNEGADDRQKAVDSGPQGPAQYDDSKRGSPTGTYNVHKIVVERVSSLCACQAQPHGHPPAFQQGASRRRIRRPLAALGSPQQEPHEPEGRSWGYAASGPRSGCSGCASFVGSSSLLRSLSILRTDLVRPVKRESTEGSRSAHSRN